MKCPVAVQVCLCHECKCSDCCHNFPNSDCCENESEKSYDMFDLLAHNIPTNSSKKTISKLHRLPTTYRNDYCRKKQLPPPTKILLPHPAIHIPNQKMYCGTSHKSDFKSYKDKNVKDCRGKIIFHKDNISCSKDKFEGKSEAKSSFSYPVPKKVFGLNVSPERFFKVYPTKGHKKIYDAKLSDSTVYKMSYKRPKELPKTNACKPKPNIVLKLQPHTMKHTSQYQNDYKRPCQTQRENLKKSPVFHPPSIPMEDKTTYKSEFYYKIPAESKRKNWNPNHRIYKTTSGQSVCSFQKHLKDGECRTNCCCFHKENDSPLLMKCIMEEKCQCCERGDAALEKIFKVRKNSKCNNRHRKNADENGYILNHQINLHEI